MAEFAAIGEVTAEAYRRDGFFEVDTGYEAVLRSVAHRAEHAELMVAVEADSRVLGSVTVVLPGSEYAEISGPGELEFRMLAVAGEARGRGIGDALTRAVLDRGRELGLGKVVLSSLDQMRTAHRLYERIGFSRLPERDWSPHPGVRLVAYEYDL
ncbi:ribosomal protein S18 acetylase RimI-like enzyme [Amycolatopsis jiangsuensis]|uniref:Ribosomal protein S18 acetylase RimI-like enzyme n=1 Tax=Amycolatopsis jiangsuensis TaxID=1181879 RepID=A0A840IWJ2_9PSEU|nr:ribosomal protein S18 acetylase RimI-like enzyme [Amycolatopsis jiangsuensis]